MIPFYYAVLRKKYDNNGCGILEKIVDFPKKSATDSCG